MAWVFDDEDFQQWLQRFYNIAVQRTLHAVDETLRQVVQTWQQKFDALTNKLERLQKLNKAIVDSNRQLQAERDDLREQLAKLKSLQPSGFEEVPVTKWRKVTRNEQGEVIGMIEIQANGMGFSFSA